MLNFGKEKRSKMRVNRELVIKLKSGEETMQVYMIDLSAGGIKVGGVRLLLAVGDQVEITFMLGRDTEVFNGKVDRQDGMYHIKRIGRTGNSFYIRIDDARFPQFMKSKFTAAKRVA